VHATQINDIHAGLGLFQDADDLLFGGPIRFQVYLLFGNE